MVTQRTLAKLGNKTRYGHIISASSTIFDEDHNPLVRAGDKAWCDVCKGAFEINATYTGFLEAGFIAGDGDLVLCHCKDNFVIAISGFTGERHPGMMSAKPAAFGIAPEQQTQQEPEQHAQTAKKKRIGVDAGFCVVPRQSTTESFESILFAGGQPEGTRELYRSLNGAGKEYKAGSILLVVDPDMQDNEQIAHMQAAKQRIDAALAPLSIQQANFLFKHKDTIEMFAAAASTASDTYGYSGQATEAAKGYFEQVEKILVEIEKTYKNQYITSGTLIGEQFFVERRRLFGQLDSVLKMFMKHRFMFNEYADLKSALGLSSRSITHRWNETGVSDIEGYATHIEKLAKYVKWMETAGKIGIGLSAFDTAAKITEACTVGRDCAKTSFTSIGEFSGSLIGGAIAGKIAGTVAANTVCAIVLGAATIEAAGAGALLCTLGVNGAIAYGSDKATSAFGGFVGESLYEVTSNDH
ncbi:PAAR domain-containing protein [Citrobacter sp. wls619]|uniref:PAAR domain-containing protein n=1 Tax=Citrobacter sp. wls619 TaxID=2576432 RepID=UPI0010C9CDE7|nr:PAAR domain-containing protein [Citrobacter sp. wls619]TKV09890.1 PAAR domain-containing protein [Citrobacter sp. wls619]